MSPRRVLVIGCVCTLGVLFMQRQPLAELRDRLHGILATASRPLEARRLAAAAGSDVDHGLLRLLEWARPRIPPEAPGVAVVAERPIAGRRAFLAIYQLVPTPAVVRSVDIPAGWLVLIQGPQRPPGWRTIAESPLGALLAPSS
jgi:hypothetical protein